MAAPLQYPLCCQPVTLYHADPAAHTITRTVVQGVHYFGGRQYREVVEENQALINELKKILSR